MTHVLAMLNKQFQINSNSNSRLLLPEPKTGHSPSVIPFLIPAAAGPDLLINTNCHFWILIVSMISGGPDSTIYNLNVSMNMLDYVSQEDALITSRWWVYSVCQEMVGRQKGMWWGMILLLMPNSALTGCTCEPVVVQPLHPKANIYITMSFVINTPTPSNLL